MIEPNRIYDAVGFRVIDGDTFVAKVDLGFYASIQIHVRMNGWDAPERGQTGYEEASQWLAAEVMDRPIALKSYKDRRSFIRWVCDVWNSDGAVVPRLEQAREESTHER